MEKEANKMLKLTIWMIAKAVADVKKSSSFFVRQLTKSADTAYSCGHVTCTAAEVTVVSDA